MEAQQTYYLGVNHRNYLFFVVIFEISNGNLKIQPLGFLIIINPLLLNQIDSSTFQIEIGTQIAITNLKD